MQFSIPREVPHGNVRRFGIIAINDMLDIVVHDLSSSA